ncbi:MAG: valine--tRNA ligase [SAR202 cluster bacterium]|nr:valine--tRNA ligase [SAR202 cluster bacterium]
MTSSTAHQDIPKAYDPKAAEQRIYQMWRDGGYFTPKIDLAKQPFVIIMPPPNVTGELHMGHALTVALEDLMTRWHRMRGEPTLLLPGTDHAGIATQVVVERMLAKEGETSRQALGRQEFERRVWQWVNRYGSRIYQQLERLGTSCDWSRKAFTLDPGPSLAVRTTFVNLYKKDLIYRGERITNWCPRCATALSDLEVQYQEENASLYHIRYKLEDGSGELVVATTRPETLLGDTAVAVNPEDERYKHAIGKRAVLPVLARKIPVIADAAVDKEFGTGALKVTPGHDPTDFEIGERHSLPIVNVLNLDGTMNENAAQYEGQDRFVARKAIIGQLEEEGLLEKVVPYRHSVGHCQRSGDVVEPIVTLQWFMKMKPLAEPAIEAVRDGRIQIVPKRFEGVYYNWMENIRDWCVSRQLWWGHRIPVWYCDACQAVMVEIEPPSKCAKCGSAALRQDPDVLDTWFSSGLWPHSTLGWPGDTEDMRYFYPGTVMETGYDILFFWVARMAMLGMANTGEIPFRTIYLHGLVLDPQGVKMSKTKGNVMDPLQLIDQYGADALRFALTTGTSPGNNMRLNEKRMEASRNFANKLWNSARFVMMNMDSAGNVGDWLRAPRPTHREDRWILSRLSRVTSQVNAHMAAFDFGEAQRTVHDFLWGEYCDWYIEMAKVRLRAGTQGADSPLPVLAYVLEQVLRLLHPFMPFVTEEVWQRLMERAPSGAKRPASLMIATYPQADPSLVDEATEQEVEAVTELVRAVRNVRAEFRIQPSQKVGATAYAPSLAAVLRSEADAIAVLAQVEPFAVASDGAASSSADQAAIVLRHGTVVVPLAGLVDLQQEMKRLREELAQHEQNVERLERQLSNQEFLDKAKPEAVERERERLETMADRQARIKELLSRLG